MLTSIGKVINGIYEHYFYLHFLPYIINNLHYLQTGYKQFVIYATLALYITVVISTSVMFISIKTKESQRKWENPALWHKTNLFMTLNYLVILVGNNNGESSFDDRNIYSMITTSTFYCPDSIFALNSTLLEICLILNHTTDIGSFNFEWHFYHWLTDYQLISNTSPDFPKVWFLHWQMG